VRECKAAEDAAKARVMNGEEPEPAGANGRKR
jgi:hypothetical protein